MMAVVSAGWSVDTRKRVVQRLWTRHFVQRWAAPVAMK